MRAADPPWAKTRNEGNRGWEGKDLEGKSVTGENPGEGGDSEECSWREPMDSLRPVRKTLRDGGCVFSDWFRVSTLVT